MNKKTTCYLWLLLLPFLALSCSDSDDYTYPSLVTEFAEIKSDESGTLSHFTTDKGITFRIVNPVNGYFPGLTFRGVCGYEVVEGNKHAATLYNLQHVMLLADSTLRVPTHDPTKVLSVWRGANYLNLTLSPKTQGRVQYWGFRIDSIDAAYHKKRYHLSLHHQQNNDPESYTTTRYASLPLTSIKDLSPGDTISFCANTYEGNQYWQFIY